MTEMTDYKFAELQKEIQDTTVYLDRLQNEHRRQTGRRYTPDGNDPLRKKQCRKCERYYYGPTCPVCGQGE